jgi:hypothetical protein
MIKSYDPACYQLAEHFLQDGPISTAPATYRAACDDLAKTVQQAVEDWFYSTKRTDGGDP